MYDYVDADVLMLARMYGRRLKGYADMGYKVLSDAQRRLDLEVLTGRGGKSEKHGDPEPRQGGDLAT